MKQLLLLCLFLSTFAVAGQTCVHDDLSKTLLFKREITRVKQQAGRGSDSCIVRITVSHKMTPVVSRIVTFTSTELYSLDYIDCRWTRSYSISKKLRTKSEVVGDEDYGDLLVGDFNFDGREDFAAKRESSNGGTYYNYYTQQKDGSFRLDKFLTDKVGYAPNKLNTSNQTLQTFAHAGVQYGETTFQFNAKTNAWKELRHLFFRSLPPGYIVLNHQP